MAYNPYCAYNYNILVRWCPLENDLDVQLMQVLKRFINNGVFQFTYISLPIRSLL
jgi:hypothetical protein